MASDKERDKDLPAWFPETLKVAMSQDRMNAIVQDHELGTMLFAYHLLTGMPCLAARRRVMVWVWNRIEADEREET